MIFNLNMSMWYNYLLAVLMIVAGVFALIKCSDFFVDSASFFAKKLKISPLVIGLTVVAFGTSLPELAVSVSDSISCLINSGNANIAIGNVVGSNICNVFIVLGFSVVFTPILIKKDVLKSEFPILIVVSSILCVFTLLFSLNGQYAILRWEGVILTLLIISYVVYLILKSKKEKTSSSETETDVKVKNMSILKAIILLIIGIAGIAIGGELVVCGAKNVALGIGDAAGWNHDLVESLVGLTVVAVGTSLPELVTSVVAAKKGENEIALGNVIGSNIFNILFIIGISSLINPLTIGNQIIVDLAVMMFAAILSFVLSLKGKLNKKDGFIMLSCYVLYLTYLILRTML